MPRRRAPDVHLARVPHPGEPRHHVLEADLVPVEPDPAHHRVLARPALAARERPAALVQADGPAGQALLTEPAPPLVLRGDHLRRAGHDRVMEAARLAAGVAGADHVARGVRVLVGHRAERVAQLVQRDQRALRGAAGGRRLRAADAAVGERVEDRERLDVLRRPGDPEHRCHVRVEDPFVRLVAGLTRVHAGGVVRRAVLAVERRRPVRGAAGQRVGQPVGVPQPQGRVLRVDRPFAHAGVPDRAVGVPDPAVRITPRAVVDRRDLDCVHVHVVAVAAERLGRPHDRQVPVHVGEEDALLVPLVTVAEDDQVQALGGRTGDLDRVDLRLGQRQRRRWALRVRRRGLHAEQQHGGHQRLQASTHRAPPSPCRHLRRELSAKRAQPQQTA